MEEIWSVCGFTLIHFNTKKTWFSVNRENTVRMHNFPQAFMVGFIYCFQEGEEEGGVVLAITPDQRHVKYKFFVLLFPF